MEWYYYVIAVVVGILVGFVNTLAGSGTLLINPFFIFIGLPADVANGTNRLGILAQTLVGSLELRRQSKVSLAGSELFIIPSVIGSIGGAILAANLDPKFLEGVIAVVMLIMIYPIVRPNPQWTRTENSNEGFQRKPLLILIFTLLGFYGGFIQAGAGIFILSTLVLLAHRTLAYSNILKNLITLFFTIPALAIYIYYDQVNWEIGTIVMVAQSTGAWFAARFLSRNPRANQVVRYLLIAMLAIGGTVMLWRLLR